MSLGSMVAELRGSVPKLSVTYAPTLINRAWRDVRDNNLWSFQLFEGNWISPGVITGVGNATTVQGSNIVSLDAASNTAINTDPQQSFSLITQRQFRIGLSGIYNVWAYDPVGKTLTLDRMWAEGSITAPFLLFQAYYVPSTSQGTSSPSYIQDFRHWISVRDIQDFIDLYVDRYSRGTLDAIDPQRSMYFFPTDVVPYQNDQNPNSATFGFYMFELWGTPLANFVYQLFGVRTGKDLVNLSDTLPFAVGEDCVLAKARYYGYEWAEANKDLDLRSRGPDFKFLMGAANKNHQELLRKYRREDRERVDNWFAIRRDAIGGRGILYYNTVAGVASTGGVPWGGP